MNRMQTNIDKAYTYVKNAISVAVVIPGFGGLKFVNNCLELLYKNLQWSGILNTSVTIEQKTQLEFAIKDTLNLVSTKLPVNKRNVLYRTSEIFHEKLINSLYNGEMSVDSINEMLETSLQMDVALEGEWLTPNDLDGLCALFLAEFYIRVKMSSTLSIVVCIDSIQALFSSIHEIHQSIDTIGFKVNDLETRFANLEKIQTSLISVTLQYLSYALFGKVKRPIVVTHNPPIYTEYYINRNENDLREYVRNSEKILLSGMGGIGKTHLCSYMFKQYVNNPAWSGELDCIGYLSFGTNEDDSVYSGVLYENHLNRETDLENIWSILEASANQQRMLLLIDDIRPNNESQNTKLVLDKLSKLQCSIILASRESSLKGFVTVHLDYLPKERCVELFKRVYNMPVSLEDEKNILEHIIINRIGRHTFALHMVAESARGFRWSLSDLEKNLDKYDFKIEQRDSDESIQKAFQKLYRMVNLNNHEENILEAFSMFPYKPLVLTDCVALLFEDANLDKNLCGKYIGALADKRWLQESVDHDSGKYYIAMHSIVASAIKGQREYNYAEHSHLIENITQCLIINHTQIFTETIHYLPFAEAIAVIFDAVQSSGIGVLMHQIGYIHEQNGNYLTAIEWYQKALVIKENVFGKMNPFSAATYNNMASAYYSLGDFQKALKCNQMTLSIFENILGKEHPKIAKTYNNIALIYHAYGDYSNAQRWYHKALDICEKNLGREHPDTATIYVNMGNVCCKQGEYHMAMKWHQKALIINEKVLGKKHPDTARIYYNIAIVYEKQDNYQKALEWYQKAIKLFERVLGHDHPNTMIVRDKIESFLINNQIPQ